MCIKVGKACGPDCVPNWVYRDFSGFLAQPIASIFNASFREGYIPNLWKCAHVVPVPKVNPPKLPEKDLRPISLTPVISKTQETFMFSWVWDIIRDQIDKGQYGALKGTSATHALITLMNDLYKDTDDWRKKQYIQVILLDYAKAFDHVDANILMNKLADLGIPDCLLRWIECFLIDRKQRVKIGNCFSDWVGIWGNVPQGTLLGVMCFLCLINDLSPKSKTIKYVDDTTIYQVSNCPNDSILQDSVDEALAWSSKNSMKIHPTKTKELFICFATNPPNVPAITINGSSIDRVNSCKLLGVIINDKLTWNEHVDKLYKKACSKLFFLSQLRKSRVPSQDIVQVYTSVVRPIMEYACQVWHGGLTVSQSRLLETIQQRALKMAFPSLSYDQALATSNLVSLHDRRSQLCERLFVEAQDPSHKLNCLLPSLKDTSLTRRSNAKYVVPKWFTNRYRDSFVPYCILNFDN